MDQRNFSKNETPSEFILPSKIKMSNCKYSLKEQKKNLQKCFANLETLEIDLNQKEIKLRFIREKIKTFKKNVKLMNLFCEKFPYQFFFEQIWNGETDMIRLYSLMIFSRCTGSMYFPMNRFSNAAFINALFDLFPILPEKHHKYIFAVFSSIVNKRVDVRKYLIEKGIFNLLNLSIPCLRFIISCLSFPPKIPEKIVSACSIRFLAILQNRMFNETDLILQMLGKHSFVNYPGFDQSVYKFIFTEVKKTENYIIAYDILRIAQKIELDEYEFLNLILHYLVKFEQTKIRRKCLKLLNNENEKFKKFSNIICNFISSAFATIEQTYITGKQCLQIIFCYFNDIELFDFNLLNLVLNYIIDTDIGSKCIIFLYNLLNSPFPEELMKDIKLAISKHSSEIENFQISDSEELSDIASFIIENIQ